jgi:RNA polymerase sigma factor (sigma-70 family)
LEKEKAFNAIYEAYYDKVCRLCRGYFNGDEAHAADAAQEVFIKVWQHLDGFRGESAISTWIYRITVNTCLLHLRRPAYKKELRSDRLPDLEASTYNPQTEARLQQMYSCIGQLEEIGKMIILMVLEGIEYSAIAAVAGISEDTLRVKIHRIKKNLSNCVQHDSI